MADTKTYAFGAGSVYMLASGLTPVKVGVLQDIQIDISADIKMLYGAQQFAVAIGRGQAKIEGKAKTGQIDLNLFNSVYSQGTIDTAGFLKIVENEAHSVPASSTYTVQVTNHSVPIVDLGVYYASTGLQLAQVASGSEATGKYSVDLTTGTYTFVVGDASAALLFNYQYKATTGNQIVISNQLMGVQPVFQLIMQEGFSDFGVRKLMTLQLNRCVSNKLTFPFKNSDFAISDIDFSAFADAAGNVGTIGVGT